MELSDRQKKIIELVKLEGPLSSEQIADRCGTVKTTIRTDLALLSLSGILIARPKVGYTYASDENKNWFRSKVSGVLVKDVKSQPIVMKEDASVYDGIVTLFLEDVGTVFVVDKDGYFVGLASRKDFLKASIGGMDINKMPIAMMMTRMPNIAYVVPEDTAYLAAKKIIDQEVDALPVLIEEKKGKDRSFKVVGRFTKTNIARLFVEASE